MGIVYFVRHGQVESLENIIYGRLPRFALSVRGEKMLEQSAEQLMSRHIRYVYSSPLLRAMQSARIIQKKLGLSRVKRSKTLLEVRTSCEGMPLLSLQRSRFDYYFSPMRKHGDETMVDIYERMKHFLDALYRKHATENVVVVSHGDPIMILLAGIMGCPMTLESIRPKNGTYIHYGEIRSVARVGTSNYVVKEVFEPNRSSYDDRRN